MSRHSDAFPENPNATARRAWRLTPWAKDAIGAACVVLLAVSSIGFMVLAMWMCEPPTGDYRSRSDLRSEREWVRDQRNGHRYNEHNLPPWPQPKRRTAQEVEK